MAAATESKDTLQLKVESKAKPKSAKFPRSRRVSCESAERYILGHEILTSVQFASQLYEAAFL